MEALCRHQILYSGLNVIFSLLKQNMWQDRKLKAKLNIPEHVGVRRK